jgi:diphthine synthase
MPDLWLREQDASPETKTLTISLISIGLTDEKDLSLRAIEEARDCDKLYAELYTMKLATTLEALTNIIGKPIYHLRRGDLEENADMIIEEAQTMHVGVLIGGDCLSATTHTGLVIEATAKGIKVNIIHGSSIFSAIAETGLSLYKFGRVVTLPFEEKGPVDTTLRYISENQEQGLHSLILLDLDNEADKYMTVNQALIRLFDAGFNVEALVIGVARLGSKGSNIRAGSAREVALINFGDPPHSLIIPGRLHFLEEDALKSFASCPPDILKGRTVKSEIDTLINKYIEGCRRVRRMMTTTTPAHTPTQTQIQDILDHVDRYLADAEFYRFDKKPTSLTSVAYSEGILDALKLLGIIDFDW